MCGACFIPPFVLSRMTNDFVPPPPLPTTLIFFHCMCADLKAAGANEPAKARDAYGTWSATGTFPCFDVSEPCAAGEIESAPSPTEDRGCLAASTADDGPEDASIMHQPQIIVLLVVLGFALVGMAIVYKKRPVTTLEHLFLSLFFIPPPPRDDYED